MNRLDLARAIGILESQPKETNMALVPASQPQTDYGISQALGAARRAKIGTMGCIDCGKPVSVNKGICLKCAETRAERLAEKVMSE